MEKKSLFSKSNIILIAAIVVVFVLGIVFCVLYSNESTGGGSSNSNSVTQSAVSQESTASESSSLESSNENQNNSQSNEESSEVSLDQSAIDKTQNTADKIYEALHGKDSLSSLLSSIEDDNNTNFEELE